MQSKLVVTLTPDIVSPSFICTRLGNDYLSISASSFSVVEDHEENEIDFSSQHVGYSFV